MKYNTILFDADGTLLDFSRIEKEAFAETFKTIGIEADEKMISDYSAINDSLWKRLEKGDIEKNVLSYRRFEMLFERYGISADAHAVNKAYMGFMCQKVYLIDGAKELCEKLYGKARMYIVTNGTDYIQRAKLSKSGLESLFEEMFTSDAVGYEKPSLKFFEHIEGSVLNFEKEKTLIVGDSLTSDIRGGINYGIDTCWYNPSGKEAPEEMKGDITFVARDHQEIYDFITQGE